MKLPAKTRAKFMREIENLADEYGSYYQLANKLGIHEVTVYHWLSGRHDPSAEALRRLRALGVDLNELLK